MQKGLNSYFSRSSNESKEPFSSSLESASNESPFKEDISGILDGQSNTLQAFPFLVSSVHYRMVLELYHFFQVFGQVSYLIP
jgi:hypothetical protein